jgi:hypothetical protein
MASSGMLRRVGLVRTDVSEEFSASIIRVTRICKLGTTLAVTTTEERSEDILTSRVIQLLFTANFFLSSPILVTLIMEVVRSSKPSVLTRATRRNISRDGILPNIFLGSSIYTRHKVRSTCVYSGGGGIGYAILQMSVNGNP